MTSIRTPITGAELSTVEDFSAPDIDAAYERAADAFQVWRTVAASDRGRLLAASARLMRERADEIAEVETLNTGKSPTDTRREARRAADCFDYYGGWADKVHGTTIPVDGPFHTYTRREPRGTAVGIIPWNVPYFFAAKKIAPALAFGNVCILKPAEETPLTALLLADILLECGVPDGVAQVVTGGRTTGRSLAADPRADLIVFTGHHETGKLIARAAAEHLVPVALELGGKSPQLVFDDADLSAAVEAIMLGIFGACGQMCIAGSRLFVHRAVYDEVLGCLVDRVQRLRVGDPRDETVDVGPQVTAAQRDKTLAMIESGRDEGARIVAEAPVPTHRSLDNGYWAPPTIFTDVDPEMTLMRNEIFGPVLAIAPFDDDDDAVEKAHQTDFGLAAGLWTSDIGRAHRLAAELNVGTVWINTYRVLSDLVPFGGVGLSGYGREGGDEAPLLYTRSKSVWTSTAPGIPAGFAGLGEPSGGADGPDS